MIDNQKDDKIDKKEDRLIRAITTDRQIRAIAATTTGVVEKSRQLHNTSPLATSALGRALTGALMIASLLKSGKEVSLTITGDGPLDKIVAEADLYGKVRGYVKNPDANLPLNDSGKIAVGKGIGQGKLIVRKDLGLKEPYQGQVPLISGEIGEDITYYFTKSEQTPSSVGVGVLVSPEMTVAAAGGFLIQLFPEAEEKAITTLEKNINRISSVTEMISEGMEPEAILNQILEGLDFKVLESKEVQYDCRCSRERVLSLIRGLDPEDIKKTLAEQGKVEIGCQFCNQTYLFTDADIAELDLEGNS